MISKIRNKIQGLDDSKRRLLRGSSWMVGGTVVSKVLVFCATILVARILTKDIYGELSIIRSTIQMFIALSSFGIGATATKYIAEYRHTEPARAVRIYYISNIFILAMAVVMMGVLFVSAESIAANLLNAPSLAAELRIAACILFFSLMNGAQTGSLAGFEDFPVIARANILNGVLEVILLPLGAWLFGLSGAIIGFGSCFLGVFVFNAIALHRHLASLGVARGAVLRGLRPADFKVVVKFSLPIAMSSWIIMVTYWFSKTFMIKADGFGSMASYGVAEQFKTQLLFLPGILSQVLLPIMSNKIAGGERDKARDAARTNIKINVAITFGAYLLILAFGKYLLMLYGKSYTNLMPLYILCFAAIIDSVCNSYVPVIISANRVWRIISYNLVWSATLIGVYFCASAYIYAENALATAYLAATVAQCVLMTAFLRRRRLI